MWSAIAAVVAAIGSGIRLASDWLAKKRDDLLLSLGSTKQSNADLTARIDAMEKANVARETSRGESERDPSSVLSDDGFQRKTDD
jgi:hypothetical protein